MIEAYLVRADWFNIIAAGVMCLLQIGGWWTTKQFLKYGGGEGNLLMRGLIDIIGLNAVGVLKVIIFTPLLIYVNLIWLSIVLNAMVLYVVINNYKYMKKLKDNLKARLEQ